MRDTDYSNTIFYKIYCKTPEITDVYIGHTTNFVKRKIGHVQSCMNEKSPSYNFKVYSFIREHGGWENWKMEIIGFKCCNSLQEACQEEQKYFEEYNATLNSIQPAKHIELPLVQEQFSKVCDDNSTYNFVCEKCNYRTANKKDFRKHIMTAKHQSADKPKKSQQQFICECGKQYFNKSGLWKHKKKCSLETVEDTHPHSNNQNETSSLVVQLLQEQKAMREENKEMREAIRQQSNYIQQQQELHYKQIQELIPKLQPVLEHVG